MVCSIRETEDRARALFGAVRWDGPTLSEDERFVLPIGTVTLVLADVEGSTRGWEERPDVMRAAIARLDAVVAQAVNDHHGVRPVEQGEGNSFVAAFSKASDALACALEIQHALLDSQVAVRIGIHAGEVQLRDEGNYVGPAINRAARFALRSCFATTRSIECPALRSPIPSAVPTLPAPMIETASLFALILRVCELASLFFFIAMDQDGVIALADESPGCLRGGATLTLCHSPRNFVGFWRLLAYNASDVGCLGRLGRHEDSAQPSLVEHAS